MSLAYDGDDIYGIGREEQMVAVKPRATPESSPDPIGKPVSSSAKDSAENAKSRRKALPSKGDAYLLRIAHPNYPEVHRKAETHLPSAETDDESMEDVADMDDRLAKEMMLAEKEKKNTAQKRPEPPPFNANREEDLDMSPGEEEMADADIEDMDEQMARDMESDKEDEEVAPDVKKYAADALRATDAFHPTDAFHRLGIGSPPARLPSFSAADLSDPDRRESSSTNATFATTTTATTAPSRKPSDGLGISLKTEIGLAPMTPVEPNFQNSDPFFQHSPLAQHRGSVSSPGGRIPAMLSGPTSPEAYGSPHPSLPSVKDMFDLADRSIAAAQQRDRHASLSSLSMPSPTAHPGFARASFSNAHPSPSMTSEPRSSLILSPPSGIRRESYPLPSAASTVSHSLTSPSDAASPHLPTPQSPEHRQSVDERTLPPLPGIGRPSISVGGVATIPAAGSGGYKCEFPGCTAPPFQTSYLLNSHANVHSTNRPHYCPVAGCPRSEGGKGFKRKNEMIRHGLVHDSPGYVCPFCPDREHKYPRPDNLQRHVRVHHTDKNREDPLLRDVLAQRPELIGPNRGRRRRIGQ